MLFLKELVTLQAFFLTFLVSFLGQGIYLAFVWREQWKKQQL